MRRIALCALVLGTAFLSSPAATPAAVLAPLAPTPAWDDGSPIHVTSPPGDSRAFVVERTGPIRVLKNDRLVTTPFLTVPNVDSGAEKGLLSMAFAPDYATSGLFYVFAVIHGNDSLGIPPKTRILEYKVSASDPDVADPTSQRMVLGFDLSAGNHIGGQLVFGPDDKLYITLGENGNPVRAQQHDTWLGKILRIDPRQSGSDPYTVPGDNPFVGDSSYLPEIWALGFRNPFRASFDPSGRLVAGDVGQSTMEEINIVEPGKNYGWSFCEGPCASPNPAFTDPFYAYGRSDGCAVIGGVVVQDAAFPGLNGRYLYGDLCRTGLRTLDLSVPGGDPQDAGVSISSQFTLQSLGTDANGCIYVMGDATAYRLVRQQDAGPPCGTPLLGPPPPPDPPTEPPETPPTTPPIDPVPPPNPPVDPPLQPPVEPPTPRVLKAIASLFKERLAMDGDGKIPIRVDCSGGLACSGALSLRTAKATRAGGAKAKRVVKLGTLRFSGLAADQRATVTLSLGAKGRKIVRELLRLKVKLKVNGLDHTTTLSAGS